MMNLPEYFLFSSIVLNSTIFQVLTTFMFREPKNPHVRTQYYRFDILHYTVVIC